MMTDVQIVQVSGDALNWLRFGLVSGLAIGLVLIALVVAIAVRVLWSSK